MESTLLGLSFGLAAGLSPGPLLSLVLRSSLEHGFRAGARVAIAPLLTDAPVILLSLLVLDRLPPEFLRGLAIFGGLFVIHLGVQGLRNPVPEMDDSPPRSGIEDLREAFWVNLLSPHPWMFWVTVGGPILVESWRRDRLDATGFLIAFFTLLVGLKILFAALVAGGRELLGSSGFRRTLAAASALLIALGVFLLYQGISGRL